MLPPASRLTGSDGFRHAVKTGRRSGTRTVVTHVAVDEGVAPARVGFVVSRAVGNAVVRNRVRRRLRHAVRDRLDDLPGGAVLVVRALPAAATADYQELAVDLGRCLQRGLRDVQDQGAGRVRT